MYLLLNKRYKPKRLSVLLKLFVCNRAAGELWSMVIGSWNLILSSQQGVQSLTASFWQLEGRIYSELSVINGNVIAWICKVIIACGTITEVMARGTCLWSSPKPTVWSKEEKVLHFKVFVCCFITVEWTVQGQLSLKAFLPEMNGVGPSCVCVCCVETCSHCFWNEASRWCLSLSHKAVAVQAVRRHDFKSPWCHSVFSL